MARILVVDDDPQIRLLVRAWLESDRHEVVEAMNGRDGLRIYRETRPDLVITDVFMPEKEGLGLIRGLRSQDRDAKIIAMSGGSKLPVGDCLELAQMLGASAVFAKPFTANDLYEAVSKVLRHSTVF
jgi:CheY-like chemotaxis protein